MDTTDDIVAVEAAYGALREDPRRQLSRFVEVSLDYGRKLASPDPARALDVLTMAIDTLHDPPAPAEAAVALELLRAVRPVAASLGRDDVELDAIARERRMFDVELADSTDGDRERLCRRAAAIRFAAGDVGAGFAELMDGLRSCSASGLDDLGTEMVLAVRRHGVPTDLIAELEAMWVELRRQRFDGNWPLWCLTALGALRLATDDVVTAQMYVRRAESILGHLARPVAGALVGGWVALACDEPRRAHERFVFAVGSGASARDERIRLLAAAGLGESLICLGRVDEARAPLAEAIAYEVGDPQSLARCHELLAAIASADGRHADAYAHLQTTRRLEQVARGGVQATERVVEVPGEGPVEVPVEGPGDIPGEDGVVDLRDQSTAAGDADDPSADEAEQVDLSPAGRAAATLRDALAHGHLDLWFQPIVDNATRRTGAAEALLRVQRDGRPTSAADLLAALTDAAVADELCAWTIDRACETLSRWRTDAPNLAVVVNLGGLQVSPQLPFVVRTCLARWGARADLLTLELDGAAATAMDASRIGVLNEVRAAGVRVGIDRFGGICRSIDTLLRLPVDVVKLDGSVFGAGVPQPLERRMVDTVVALARAFGFEVIAAGVETEGQFDLQVQFGCHGAQGLLLGQPVPEGDFRQRLAGVA